MPHIKFQQTESITRQLKKIYTNYKLISNEFTRTMELMQKVK